MLRSIARRFSLVSFLAAAGFASIVSDIPTGLADIIGADARPRPIAAWAGDELEANQALLASAIELYASSKIDEARDALLALRERDEALPDPDLVLVWLHLRAQNVPEAKQLLETLAAARPRDPQVALTLGQIALAEGRLADAGAQLERAALLPIPSNWSPPAGRRFANSTLDTLATVYERQQRWMDVKSILNALIPLGDDRLDYTSRLSRALYHLGEVDEAQRLLMHWSENSGSPLPLPLMMADLAFTCGDMQRAQEHIDSARSLHPESADVELWYAEWLLHQGEVDAASLAATAAGDKGIQDSRLWLIQAHIAMLREEYDQAETWLRQAVAELSQQPASNRLSSAMHLLSLAIACRQEPSALSEALEIAEKNALEHPRDPLFVGTLGWIYSKAGRRDEAEVLLQRALELNPQVAADLSYWVADFYSLDPTRRELSATFLRAALEGMQGQFLMRPQASKLQATMLN